MFWVRTPPPSSPSSPCESSGSATVSSYVSETCSCDHLIWCYHYRQIPSPLYVQNTHLSGLEQTKSHQVAPNGPKEIPEHSKQLCPCEPHVLPVFHTSAGVGEDHVEDPALEQVHAVADSSFCLVSNGDLSLLHGLDGIGTSPHITFVCVCQVGNASQKVFDIHMLVYGV